MLDISLIVSTVLYVIKIQEISVQLLTYFKCCLHWRWTCSFLSVIVQSLAQCPMWLKFACISNNVNIQAKTQVTVIHAFLPLEINPQPNQTSLFICTCQCSSGLFDCLLYLDNSDVVYVDILFCGISKVKILQITNEMCFNVAVLLPLIHFS